MLRKIILPLAMLFLVSCAPIGRHPEFYERTDGAKVIKVTCINPGDNVYTSKVKATIDANAEKLKVVVNAGIGFDKKIDEIRKLFPGMNEYEILDYRFCLMYANGAIDGNKYTELIQKVIPGLKSNAITLPTPTSTTVPQPGATQTSQMTSCTSGDYGPSGPCDLKIDGRAGVKQTICRPDGDCSLWVNNHSVVTLTGAVKNIYIKLVDNGSDVDLSGLSASNITMIERLDGKASLRVNSSGNVTFQKEINGGSKLYVVAKNNVEFLDKIDNGATEVHIDARGHIHGKEVNGGAKVYCAKPYMSCNFDHVYNGSVN